MICWLLRTGLLLAALLLSAGAWQLHDQAALSWPVAIILSGLALPTFVALAIAIQFLLAIRLGDGRWTGATAAWASEVPASLRAFWFDMPVHGQRPLCSDTGQRIPVLLVHGYGCNQAVWRPVAAWLQRRGHPYEAITLEPAFGSIDTYTTTIADAVERLCERHGYLRVALIGHSMGGLAIRAYLGSGAARAPAGVITVGTPHQGTRLAALGLAANARQMRRDSRWLAALNARQDTIEPGIWTVLLSRHDNIVYPQSEQTLIGATTLRLDGVGHLAMLQRPDCRQHIGQALDRAELRAGQSRRVSPRHPAPDA